MHVERVTLAVEDLERMAAFYNEVFECGLHADPASPLWTGRLADMVFSMCPNSIAGVVAEQNRHQLRLAVDDVDALADRVVRAGGTVVNRDALDSRVLVGISDPEGNTYEIVSRAGPARA